MTCLWSNFMVEAFGGGEERDERGNDFVPS